MVEHGTDMQATESHADEAVVRDHTACLATNTAEIETLKRSDVDQWTAINNLRNRLPLWATMAMTGGGALIGFLGAHFKP